MCYNTINPNKPVATSITLQQPTNQGYVTHPSVFLGPHGHSEDASGWHTVHHSDADVFSKVNKVHHLALAVIRKRTLAQHYNCGINWYQLVSSGINWVFPIKI